MYHSLRTSSRRLWLFLFLATVSLSLSGLAFAQGGQNDPQNPVQRSWVMVPTLTGTTQPLYSLHDQYVPPGLKEAEEVKRPSRLDELSRLAGSGNEDPALQTGIGPLISVTTGMNFDGIGEGFTGPNGTYSVGSVPPDTDMAAGTTQVVSLDNTAFAVFSKSSGAVLAGPFNTNVLWSVLGTSSACDADNDGDGVVKFDQLAQRWIITQFAVTAGGTTGPFADCVAISQTSDATGSWTVFQFNPSVRSTKTDFPDYPKIAVWPNTYSMTFDMFNAAGSTYEGAGICGIDRIALLNGNNPTIVCAQLTSSDYALLPVDMDGSIYPASGAKALYIEQNSTTSPSTALYMYRAAYNFTAGTVTVDPQITITVSSYNSSTCSNTQKCAPQPAHTGTVQNGTFASESKLDTLAFHLMFRAAYRNFGTYESILLNQPVRRAGTGTNTAERWYEIRTPFGTPTVYQQSTFSGASDTTNYRWMGSIAQDQQGNMLLGYSESNATSLFPSVYITGRVPTDTLSTMETESQVYAGLNSQVNLSGYAYGYRWGDYTSMMMDPDDCTFWYSGEYLKLAGLFNWSNRVLSFSFPGCSSNAAITSPVPSSTLTSGTATFLWTPGTGTPSYTLAIGKTQGGSDYCGGVQSYAAGVFTTTLSCLPTDGSTFWVRLSTIGGANGFNDYQYTAPSLSQSTTTTVSSTLNPSTYGQSVSFTATVSANSGTPTGTVQFAVDGTNFGSPVTLASGSATSGSTTTLSAGTHTVTAAYTPGSGFLASNGTLSGGQVVNQAVLTVTANNAGMTYGGTLPTFTAGYSGFVNGDGQGVLSGSPSLTTTATSSSPVGNYTITAALGTLSATNYTFLFVNGTLTINQLNASVTPNAGTKVYGQSDPTLTGTLVGFLPGDNVTATYSRTPGETVDGSPYTISASLSPTGVLGNYNITYNTALFTITPAPASVTPNAAGKVYGQTDPTLTGTLVGFLPADNVTATYSRTPGETVAGSPYTISAVLSAGGQLLTRKLGKSGKHDPNGGLDNYTITYNTANFTITPALLTVTANNASIADGSPLPTFTASYSGFVNGDGQGVLSGSPSLTTTAPQNPPAGTYPINAAQGTLSAANYTFTFVNGILTVTPVTGQITSPPKGSTLTGSAATFTWSHESGATSYQLWVGSTPGAHDLGFLNTSGLAATINGLPTDGRMLYVTLYGYVTSWTVQDAATYTAATIVKAQITAPTKGSTLTGPSATFIWSAETGATSYQVWVGHSAGAHDIATVTTSALTATVNGLPIDGSQIYVTLYGYTGSWTAQDSATYTAYNPVKASITSPPKGSILNGRSVTFTWSAESGGTSYQLWIGNTPGGHDLAIVTTAGLSATVTTLPTDGRQIYVSLYGYAGSWTLQDTASYTAATLANAQITSPPKGSTLPGASASFTWSAENGATSYQIWVGSTPGGHDIAVQTSSGLGTTINGIPTDGREIYVSLYGYAGTWSVQDTASYTAALIIPQ